MFEHLEYRKLESLEIESWEFERLKIKKFRLQIYQPVYIWNKLPSTTIKRSKIWISFLHHHVPLSNVVSNVKSRASPTSPIYVRTLSSHPRLRLNQLDLQLINRRESALYRGHGAVDSITGEYATKFSIRRLEYWSSADHTSRREIKKKMLIPRDEDGHLAAIALKYDRDYFAPLSSSTSSRCVTFRFNLQRFTNKISIEAEQLEPINEHDRRKMEICSSELCLNTFRVICTEIN